MRGFGVSNHLLARALANSCLFSTLVQISHLQFNKSIYNQLFSKLKSPSNLSETKKLHANLIQNGYFHPNCTDPVLGSQLVNIYSKFGSFNEAFLTFNKLPEKNNIAWNSILRSLVGLGQFTEAIEFFNHSMMKQGTIPDNYTYPLVLKACAELSDLEEGKKVFKLIKFSEIHHNFKCNIYVECAMIDMFAKCGSLDKAYEVFEEMPRRDLASWTAIINGTLRNGEWIKAFSLFSRMRFEGLQPDSVNIAVIIQACGRIRIEARLIGLGLECYVLKSGFKNDLHISNALIDMYCKSGNTHEANRMFCEMDGRDEVSWSTMISGYSQNHHYNDCIKLYSTMKTFGIRTNALIATSILTALGQLKLIKYGKEMHNYVLKHGFESDPVLGSALIDMYSNCSLTRKAENQFEIMSDKDITIWNSMIVGYVLNENFYEAFRIFRRIWESKIKPNHITLIIVLPLCTKMGNFQHGKEIHGYVTKTDLGKVVSVPNALIDMYCKCGYLELGVKVFEHTMDKSIVTYNTIISGYGIHGHVKNVFSLFNQMKEVGIRPNKVTFGSVLSACSHAGMVNKGWYFYNSMINDYRIIPEIEHYSCMVDLLSRAGKFTDACEFIGKMGLEPDSDIWGSLLGACRGHNMVEFVELIEKRVFTKRFIDSGYYVTLSNIFAYEKRWEDCLKVRTMIKENGLVKKPAYSSIQIGSCVHVFHAGGEIHREFDQIKEVLEILILEMKTELRKSDLEINSNNL